MTNNESLDIKDNTTQYVDEFGNPIDPSLIDENGNYIGETKTQYVDEFGNPIDPSLIDENGNYIGGNNNLEKVENVVTEPITSASENQMKSKEFLTSMVTFDYNNVPITDIVNSIILDAINKGASDIHFDPFDDGIKIRIRIDGILKDYSIVPLFVKKNMITRIKIISGMNITESRTPQDGAIRTELANKSIDLRVSCLPTNMGEKIVIRIMDYSMSASGIEALDFNEKNLEKVKKMLALPNGIVLVTGATGTGKSTTVYSMLQRLNVEGTNLVTVEDPIEMNIDGINQVQAQSDIGLDFATVLRSILRQDPDVIMIGEIRDDETARIAVRASITGHLVLSTIHTNNSLNTIERLTDMSVERYLLGSSLSGIVSQKLARRLCPKCRRLRKATEYERDIFNKVLHKDIDEIYEPVGCSECSKGYRGRIAIHEVLLLNQLIKDAITKGIPKDKLRAIVYGNNGTETMLQDGLEKVLEGKTSFEEILKLIDLEDDLGSGTQLGLDNQIEETNMSYGSVNSNGPININITPDMFTNLFNNKDININNNNNNNNKEEKTIDHSSTKDNEEIKVDHLPIDEFNEELNPDTEVMEQKLDTLVDEPTLEEPIINDRLSDIINISNKKNFNEELNNYINDIKNNIIELNDDIKNKLISLKDDDKTYKNTIKNIDSLFENNKNELIVRDNILPMEINNNEDEDLNSLIDNILSEDSKEIIKPVEDKEEITNTDTLDEILNNISNIDDLDVIDDYNTFTDDDIDELINMTKPNNDYNEEELNKETINNINYGDDIINDELIDDILKDIENMSE